MSPHGKYGQEMISMLVGYAEYAVVQAVTAVLDRAAQLEAEIASDVRHTSGEIAGAHMLGASLRAALRAPKESSNG